MFKFAVLAFVGLATQVEGSSIHKSTKKVYHKIIHSARPGIKGSLDITPGTQTSVSCDTWKTNCHSCVSNLCQFDSKTQTCGARLKGSELDIEDWFTAANQCTDTLNLCQIPHQNNDEKVSFVSQALSINKTPIPNHFVIDKSTVKNNDFVFGWDSTAARAKTIVPQDYFCSYSFSLQDVSMDFAMMVKDNSTYAKINQINPKVDNTIWAQINHREKLPTTYWDGKAIRNDEIHGNFLIGPANEHFTVIFTNPTKRTLHEASSGFEIDIIYKSQTQFAKLVLQGKAGFFMLFIVICLLVCCVAIVASLKEIGKLFGCIHAEDEPDDDFQKFKEKSGGD